jgi:putative transferase (TIGR04331 family)
VPTIAYLQRDVWALARQAEPHLERLAAAGVVFETPQAAAAKVAEVWDDVAGWWARADIQAARCAFRDEYARTSRVWWWHWMKALWRL